MLQLIAIHEVNVVAIMSMNANTQSPSIRPGPKARGTVNHVLAPQQTANYIADIVLELRNLAKGQALTTLQGLLEVTFYEAFAAANQVEVPQHEIERLRELSKASHV